MPVSYTVVLKGNPQKSEEPKRYYAQAKSSGEITYKQLSGEIAGRSSLNSGDVYNVLEVLEQIMRRELAEGRIVRLGDFGTFHLSISGKGADSVKEYKNSHIKGSKICFNPGKGLKRWLQGLQYRKLAADEE